MFGKFKILYIHNEKRDPKYGSHFINDLIIKKLREKKIRVDSVYPDHNIDLMGHPLHGIRNILFFYSLITKKRNIKKYNLIQGTTYTPLAFLNGTVPVVSHFGSTVYGFLKSVPPSSGLKTEHMQLLEIMKALRQENIFDAMYSTKKALKDISDIEMYVASKSNLVIATSEIVKQELLHHKIPEEKIVVIHNAIEDFWFEGEIIKKTKPIAHLVYLGRMGDDPFTVKLKGITRLLYIFKKFIGMCKKTEAYESLFLSIPQTHVHLSIAKEDILPILRNHFGDIYVNPGRYEGFCLSLIEAMSQGLVPIIFPIGVAPEIIRNGKNGFIVSNLQEMILCINMISGDAKKRYKMAQAAITTASQFKSDIFVDNLKNAYKSILR